MSNKKTGWFIGLYVFLFGVLFFPLSESSAGLRGNILNAADWQIETVDTNGRGQG